jgi:hypothetical protein
VSNDTVLFSDMFIMFCVLYLLTKGDITFDVEGRSMIGLVESS